MPFTSSVARARSGVGQRSRKKRSSSRSLLAVLPPRAACRWPCAAGASCPSPGRPRRTGRSRCSPPAPPARCTSVPGEVAAPCSRHVLWNPAGAEAASRRLVDLGADRGVRADERALVALDADGRVPDRDLLRDAALLPLRRARRARCRRPGRRSPAAGRRCPPASRPSRAARSPARPRGTVGGRSRVARDRAGHRAPRAGARASRRRPRSCAATTSARACRRSSRSPRLMLRDAPPRAAARRRGRRSRSA